MDRVIEYKIEMSNTTDELAAQVNKSIAEGYVPSGPLFSHDGYIHQVLVKFESAEMPDTTGVS